MGSFKPGQKANRKGITRIAANGWSRNGSARRRDGGEVKEKEVKRGLTTGSLYSRGDLFSED